MVVATICATIDRLTQLKGKRVIVNGAVRGVERVENSGRAECVDATVAEGRRRARTGAAIRLVEPDRVAVFPDRLARGHLVAGDDLVATALLLRVE